MGGDSGFANLITAMNAEAPLPADMVTNSPYCQWHRGLGDVLYTTKTINPGGAGAQTFDLFTISGVVELHDLWGVFDDVTDVTTLSGCWFDWWDGTNSVPLTLNGVGCSGAAMHSSIHKLEDATQSATFLNASQARFSENDNGNKRAFQGGLLVSKYGTDTKIRFRCTTDASTDCQIRFGVVWNCRHVGGTVVAS